MLYLPTCIKQNFNLLMGHGRTFTEPQKNINTYERREKRLQEDVFKVEDIRKYFLGFCDIPELKVVAQLKPRWKKLSENESLWQKIGMKLQNSNLISKEQVKKYYETVQKQAHNCFDGQKDIGFRQKDIGFRNELNALYNSERIADINLLREVCQARDTLVVWDVLQNEIGGNEQLDLENLNSIEALFTKAKEFHEWCNQNQIIQLLNRLDLSGRQLTSLPTEIGNLAALQALYIYNNQLTSLPEGFGNLAALQVLWIDNNQLTSLPEGFGNLAALQKLRLYNNQLTSLPEGFENLAALQTLWLHNNQLTSLPEGFGNLAALQELWLQNNQLTSLPEGFGNLNLSRFNADISIELFLKIHHLKNWIYSLAFV